MPYVIRRLGSTDLHAYRQLRRQALEDFPSAFAATPASEQSLDDEQLIQRFDSTPGQAVWGAFSVESRLCALLGMYRDLADKLAHKAHLFGMYVSPPHRGQGLATALIQTAIAHARQLNLHQILLESNADNHMALRLYEQNGFQVYGRAPAALCISGQYFDEVLMILALRRISTHTH